MQGSEIIILVKMVQKKIIKATFSDHGLYWARTASIKVTHPAPSSIMASPGTMAFPV